MQGSTLEGKHEVDRLAAMEASLVELGERVARLEARVGQLSEQAAIDQKQLKRLVDMKTARTGEMSSRIAQRIAKIEAAVELLAREESREPSEEMSD